jgi:hypothetical protein
MSGDFVTKIREGSDNTVVAPSPIFLSHANDERFDIGFCPGAARFPLAAAVVFVGDEFAVPSE